MTGLNPELDRFQEVETGEAFTLQGPRVLKVELSETSVVAKNGAMVAYQGDVSFEHKGGGLGRLLKKAATGESLRLMEARGSGELFLAHQAMLVHVLRIESGVDHRQRREHPGLRDRHRVGRDARQGRHRRGARRRAVQHPPARQRARRPRLRR